MTVNRSLLSDLIALPVRALAGMMPQRAGPDEGFDPYEPAPVSREEVSKLFNLNNAMPWTPDAGLRASERRELDSVAMIRGALYADN